MTIYTISAEYEPRMFDESWPEVSTGLYFLIYTYFWWRWKDKFPELIIISRALDVCNAGYIFRNYYKSLKKRSYEKPDYFIDDDDDDDDDDENYAVDGCVNDPNVITDEELEGQIKSTQKKSGTYFHHICKESK